MIWDPFFWGVMASILMDACTSAPRPWWVNGPIRIFLYVACAMAVDRFFLVVPL